MKPRLNPLSQRGAGRFLKTFARENRNSMTKAEKILWYQVLHKDKLNYRFLRQKVIGKYIVDFFCFKLNLVIEADGETHLYKKQEDMLRDEFLQNLGYKVLRFWNYQIETDLEFVKKEIIKTIKEQTLFAKEG